jgi:hypothetical protein
MTKMTRHKAVGISILCGAALLALPHIAAADLVYGTMLIGKTAKAKVTFQVTSGKTVTNVTTDANGKFRTTLKPGKYAATYTEGGKTYKAVLHAEEYPVKEDVTFAL